MRTVFILRHAKSSWTQGLSDHERPLNNRGLQDAPRVGLHLREAGLVPDLILSSTALRASSTARAVAKASGYDGEIRLHEQLYNAPAETHIQFLRELASGVTSVMIVAHNPGLEELLHKLTGEYEALQSAALAQVVLPIANWSELDDTDQGRLVRVWRPDEI